jgi:RNA polymerase sigma factor (sigma-70 family)
MAAALLEQNAGPAASPVFATTHWSIVCLAGEGNSPAADAALEQLCRAYWYPLYAHVRRRGHDPDEAQDLTQAFFERLLEKSFLRAVDRNKGRFRTFLLTALDHFLAKEWRRSQTLKRGGGSTFISLDDETAEDRYRLEPVDEATPERVFERRWALTLLDRAMEHLGAESAAAGKAPIFEALKSVLGGDPVEVSQTELAVRLGMTANALNVALARLRRRFGELVREEIAQTVSQPGEVDEELRCLAAALRG